MCSTVCLATQTCTHVMLMSVCLTGQVVQTEELIDRTADTSVHICPQMGRLKRHERGKQVRVQTALAEHMEEVEQ